MARELDGLHGHAFLHTAIAGEGDDVVVENGVRTGVVFRRGHLLRNGIADGIRDALAERSRGGLDPGGLVKLRVTGRTRAERAEFFDLLDIETGVTREVQPAVKEHRAVTRTEDETVAVEPLRLRGIVTQGVAEENRADLGTAQAQATATGSRGLNGVHGEAPGLGGRLREGSSIQCHRILGSEKG